MKTKPLALFVLIFLCTTLAGCTSAGFDNTDLLRPPRATGDKAQIQEVIESKAGGDYTLKYPQNGDYRSAIITQDLDKDGIEEAIALYRPSGETSATHILFIKEIDGVWQATGDFTNQNTEVDKICIGDIDGDGSDEVAVSWSNYVAPVNQMTVYLHNGKKMREIQIDETYSQFILTDLTNDNIEDILLLSLGASDIPATAKLLQYNTDLQAIYTRSVTEMSSAVTRYTSVQAGETSDKNSAVFVDGMSMNNTLTTEVLYWNQEKAGLENPLYTVKNGVSSNRTERATSSVCQDINSDGIMEIPTVTSMPKQSTEKDESVCNRTDWNTIRAQDGRLTSVMQTVINSTDGYYFIIPDKWTDKITARIDTTARSITFYEWVGTGRLARKGSSLLTIQVFTEKDWSERKGTEGFVEMLDHSGLIYAVRVPEEESMLTLSLSEISENLKLIDG